MPEHGLTRFTAWLTERERYELERIAAQQGFSLNYTLRVALRLGLGLPVEDRRAQAIRDRQETTA